MKTLRLSIDLDSLPYGTDMYHTMWDRASQHPEGFDFSKEDVSFIGWEIVGFEQPHTVLVEVKWEKLRDRI